MIIEALRFNHELKQQESQADEIFPFQAPQT